MAAVAQLVSSSGRDPSRLRQLMAQLKAEANPATAAGGGGARPSSAEASAAVMADRTERRGDRIQGEEGRAGGQGGVEQIEVLLRQLGVGSVDQAVQQQQVLMERLKRMDQVGWWGATEGMGWAEAYKQNTSFCGQAQVAMPQAQVVMPLSASAN